MQVSPLSWVEWKIVLYLSFPVSTLSTLTCYAINCGDTLSGQKYLSHSTLGSLQCVSF